MNTDVSQGNQSGLPRLKVERRAEISRPLQVLAPFVSVAFALLVGAILLLLLGIHPLEAYAKMLQGAFGTMAGWLEGNFNSLSEVAVKTTPLLLTGLAVAIPLRAGLWNIGAEGQLYMGAFAASGVALAFLAGWPTASGWLVIPLMVLAGFACGGLFGSIPGVLKAKFNTNEIITTLMLNYVAIYWVQYLIHGPWADPTGFPLSAMFADHAWFPRFFGTRVHLGLILAVVAAVVVYLIFVKTRIGFETKVVGANPNAATLGGISKVKIILWVMFVGGAMAGLAGLSEVGGIQHRLIGEISPLINPYGYTGIAVALLAKGHPLGLIPSAITFSVLFVGGEFVQQVTFISIYSGEIVQVSFSIVLILEVLIIFSIIGADFLSRYHVLIVRGRGSA